MTDAIDPLITLTADIVSAHVSNNNVAVSEVETLIGMVHGALKGLGQQPVTVEKKPQPAVSIKASVKPDYLVCLEDGKRMTMLRRYLKTHFDMTPAQYREKWGLPSDYPMSAPNYSRTRSELAKARGLGRKPKAAEVAPADPVTAKPAEAAAVKPAKVTAKTPAKAAKAKAKATTTRRPRKKAAPAHPA